MTDRILKEALNTTDNTQHYSHWKQRNRINHI